MSRPASASGGRRWWMRRAVLPWPRCSTRIAAGSTSRVTRTSPAGAAAIAMVAGRSASSSRSRAGLDEHDRSGRAVEDAFAAADLREDAVPGAHPARCPRARSGRPRARRRGGARRRPRPAGAWRSRCTTSRHRPARGGWWRRPDLAARGGAGARWSSPPPPQIPNWRRYSRLRRCAATTEARVSVSRRNWSCSTTSQPR